MHKFGSVKECPKCGEGWCKRTWQAARKACGTLSPPAHQERLKTTCSKCGYTWYEKPKDAE